MGDGVKIWKRILIYGCLISFGGVVGVPYLENQMLYYPEKAFFGSPEDFDLNHEDVQIRTEDGVSLHAWMVGEKKHKPVVLFFHGNAGNISHRLDRVVRWRDFPVRVLLLDYRGYGQSQGKPDEEGLYEDAKAAYQYLRNVEKLSPNQIFLFGESLGGAVAIELATQFPVASLTVESTFTSLKKLAAKLFPFVPSMAVSNSYNSISKISGLRIPLTVIHGTEDEIVPFEMGKELFETAPEPKRFLEVKGAHHNDLYLQAGSDYLNLLKSSFAYAENAEKK